MHLGEYIEKLYPKYNLSFLPRIERELVFNFEAYKLKLAIPLTKFRTPSQYTNGKTQVDNFDKVINDVQTIHICSQSDLEIFERERVIEPDKWIYNKENTLFLTITDPVFYKSELIQEAKCWLISNELYLMNYIKRVNSNLAKEYFKRKQS